MFWTLGGLYFSWTNIKEIRGENLRKKDEILNLPENPASPKTIIDELSRAKNVSEIGKIQIVEIFNEPFYEIKFQKETILADAQTGKIRPHITEDEAKKIALESLVNSQNIK